MNTTTILLIAIALALDAFAVSIASGIAIKNLRIRHAATIALWFGIFQALMPLIGWICGIKLREKMGHIDHYIAFALLLFIGCKMIYESFKMENIEKESDPLNTYTLFILSIATSIDALATGISFAMLGVNIIQPSIIIGIVTFIMSFCGVLIGDKGSHFFEKKIEIVGGLILIAIGIRILLEQ